MSDRRRGAALIALADQPIPCAAASSDGRWATRPATPPAPPRRARLRQVARDPNQSADPRRGWVLEFEPKAKPWIEPLMGWTASADVDQQVRLTFPTKESALRYALRHGLSLDIEAGHPRALVPAFARWTALLSNDHRSKADVGQTVA